MAGFTSSSTDLEASGAFSIGFATGKAGRLGSDSSLAMTFDSTGAFAGSATTCATSTAGRAGRPGSDSSLAVGVGRTGSAGATTASTFSSTFAFTSATSRGGRAGKEGSVPGGWLSIGSSSEFTAGRAGVSTTGAVDFTSGLTLSSFGAGWLLATGNTGSGSGAALSDSSTAPGGTLRAGRVGVP